MYTAATWLSHGGFQPVSALQSIVLLFACKATHVLTLYCNLASSLQSLPLSISTHLPSQTEQPSCCVAASVVFWGAPLLQLYEYLRSNICSVSIKSLRPATAPEIERMHGDCAICWGEMAVVPAVHAATVVGTAVRSSTGIDTQPQVAAAEAAAVDGPEQQGGVQMSCVDNESPANKDVVQQPPAVPGLQVPIGAEAANNLINQSKTAAVGVACAGAELVSPFNSSAYGHTLPCGHAYHSQCLNQVRSCMKVVCRMVGALLMLQCRGPCLPALPLFLTLGDSGVDHMLQVPRGKWGVCCSLTGK